MSNKRNALGLGAIGLLAGFASGADSPVYKVSATLSHNGHFMGAPAVVAYEGTPAAMEVSGKDGYRFTVIVKAAADGAVRITTILRTAYGSGSPVVQVQLGQTAAVSVGEMQMSLSAAAIGK